MSTETHVFFRGKLPSKAALSRAMKELGFPFSIKPATGSLEEQSGFMPMTLRREETGVELDVYDDHEEFAAEGVDASFERRASFRWSGDFQEAVAGMCAAAAVAKLMDGVVFDEAENRLLSVNEAIEVARKNLATLLKPEAKPRFGTRPADIKRCLKPLLKQRSDLALIGRLLIIRPVRHLLRGVYFDRTSDKYGFQVLRYVTPLFPVEGGFGYRQEIHPVQWKVWQPYFEDMLFDSLAEDIFDRVGKILSLGDFASELNVTYLNGRDRFQVTRVTAFILAGQRERAVALIDEIEQSERDNNFWRHWVDEQRAFLKRDISSVCAEFRSKEAEAAAELKLGDIWQPAPFPAEVLETERITKCAEPRFPKTPWISRPPGLIEEVPERPGEIRFGKIELWRNGRVILLAPLTRDAAEDLHRTYQDYVLATRLPRGTLLVLCHRTGWSPHNPEQPRNPDYVPSREFHLEAYGSLGRLQTNFDECLDRPGIVRMGSVSNYDRISGSEVWYAFNDRKKGEKNIWDHRYGRIGCVRRTFSDTDISLCEFEAPSFGEYTDLWRRVGRYLENEGFGAFA